MQSPDMSNPKDPKQAMEDITNYKFTPEELRVLKECNTESFFQRSLPLGSLLGLTTYYGIKANYFRGSPKWGPTPKVALAVTVGYFLGKFSYQRKCAEKLMQLPNSKLAEMLWQRKRGGFQESLDPPYTGNLSMAPISSLTPGETYSEVSQPQGDLDSYPPTNAGLDDSGRLTLDSPASYVEEPLELVAKGPTINYDDLRKKNREDYQKSRGQNYRGAVEQPPPIRKVSPPLSDDGSVPGSNRNKYGDVWE